MIPNLARETCDSNTIRGGQEDKTQEFSGLGGIFKLESSLDWSCTVAVFESKNLQQLSCQNELQRYWLCVRHDADIKC